MNHHADAREPTITTPDRVPSRAMGPTSIRFLFEASRGGAYSVIELHAAPGFAGPPMPHHHTREEASFVVLEGALTFDIAGASHRVDAGGLAHLPPGVDFTWKNASAEAPARFLCIYAPAGFEQMFLDVERAVVDRGEPPTPAAMRELMPPIWQKYGIAMAKP